MRSIQEIKKKKNYMQRNKIHAFNRDDDMGYRAWTKCEKLLNWVLDEDADLKKHNRRRPSHKKIKTDMEK